MDPNILNSLSRQEQQQFVAAAEAHQVDQLINISTFLTDNCFNACINDFTSKLISKKEERCITSCVEKFNNYSTRVALRHQEIEHNMREKAEGDVTPAANSSS